MSINDETRRLAQARRQALIELNDTTVLALADAWADAWDTLEPEYRRTLAELLDHATTGAPITTAHLERSELLQQSLQITHERVEELSTYAGERIGRDVEEIVQAQPPATLDQLRSQLPPGRSGAQVAFSAVDEDALAAMVARTTGSIVSRTQPLTEDMERTMRQALTRGMAAGDNPRETAHRMIRDAERGFTGGLGRAMTIARTEQLDAARAADMLTLEANTDVADGWRWMATLDADTCIACAVRHGTLHPPDQFGPEGHPNCRCTSVAALKSWSELGIEGVPEPPGVINDGDGLEFFNSLDEQSQRTMMGPTRYQAWQNGDLHWEDLAQRRENPDWRPSWQPTPVSAL